MTQKELLENVLSELVHIKKHMPNGELKLMLNDMKDMKEDISELKYMLLNPEDGVIVKTNQNTQFRRRLEADEKELQLQLRELEDLKKWKGGVNKALWILFAGLIAIVFKLIFNIPIGG